MNRRTPKLTRAGSSVSLSVAIYSTARICCKTWEGILSEEAFDV